jgi:replicative DNA helicase
MNQASIAMKQIARELEVPVIVAAQLGRGASGEKTPQLADFKETGQIEQDADVAILIWHENEHESHLCVEKNRDGATGLVPVVFDRPKMRFIEREDLRNA